MPRIYTKYVREILYINFLLPVNPAEMEFIMEKIRTTINETYAETLSVEKTDEPAAITALRAIAAEKKSFTSKFFVSTQAFKSYQAVMLTLHSRVIQYVNATIAGEAVDTRDIATCYHVLSVMLRLCVNDRYVSTRMCWTNGFIPRFITAAGTMRHNGEYRVFQPCSLQTFQKNVESLFLNIYDGVVTVDPEVIAAEKAAKKAAKKERKAAEKAAKKANA